MLECKEWRDVPGYEGLYQISIETPEGICRRICKNGKLRPLSNNPRKVDGRVSWDLQRDGKEVVYQAARWIALTFPELVLNSYFEGAHIDHIDTDVMNNNPSNLRWVTSKENSNNPITKQHLSEGKTGLSTPTKPVVQLQMDGEFVCRYPSVSQAAKDTGVCATSISHCCNGKRKSAGGFIWKEDK